MTGRKFKPHTCVLDENGPESIHRAVALAQQCGLSHDLDDRQSARLAILIEEVVTNLYDHGGVGTAFYGSVTLADDGDGLRVTICDSGTPFDPREADAIDMPNAERGGGVGLAMIRAWADILDYRREDGLNRLELRMRD